MSPGMAGLKLRIERLLRLFPHDDRMSVLTSLLADEFYELGRREGRRAVADQLRVWFREADQEDDKRSLDSPPKPRGGYTHGKRKDAIND